MAGTRILGWPNALRLGTISATDSATGYDPENVADGRPLKPHKFNGAGTKYWTVDMNLVANPGFETGDFTGWTQGDAVISSANPASGTYHARLVASASIVTGPTKDTIVRKDGSAFNPADVFKLSYKMAVSGYASGHAYFGVRFLDSEGNVILSTWLTDLQGDQSYVTYTKTIGAGGDLELPAGTYGIQLRSYTLTSTLTLDVDDVLFYEQISPDSLGIVGHNLWDANATVSVEYSTDDTEAITSWSEALAGFTPPDNRALIRTFTAQAARAWRIKAVTANLAAYAGHIFLGPRLDFPRAPDRPFSPGPERITGGLNRNVEGGAEGAEREKVAIGVRAVWSRLLRSFIQGSVVPLWDNHLSYFEGIFWQWNPDDAYVKTLWGHIDPEYDFEEALKVLERTETFGLDLVAVKEE